MSILEDQKVAELRIHDQLDELLRWESVTIGRDDRVLALKWEVNELLVKLNLPLRYVVSDQDDGE